MNNIEIRNIQDKDITSVLNIYSHYVLNTAISFEYETPSIEEFTARVKNITTKYPYLVAVENGVIVGYAYAATFINRKAYDRSCELTIYLDKNHTKKGIGKLLYNELEKNLKEIGILNLYACIGVPDKEDEFLTFNSYEFHKHLGFKEVGKFTKCGYKFNRWYNMVWMEKLIGKHETIPS